MITDGKQTTGGPSDPAVDQKQSSALVPHPTANSTTSGAAGAISAEFPSPQRVTRKDTVMDKAAYENYVALQDEVKAYLTSAQQSRPPPESVFPGTNLANVHPSVDVLRSYSQSDAVLKHWSTVQPSYTDEEEYLWRFALVRIHQWWRMVLAKRERQRRSDAVTRKIAQLEAAEKLQRYFRLKMSLMRSRRRQQKARDHRRKIACTCILQAYLRGLQSRDVTVGNFGDLVDRLKAAERLQVRRHMCVVVIQSVVRSFMVRRRMAKENNAAEVLQRTARLYRLFKRVRVLVWRIRAKRKETEARILAAAIVIQRFVKRQLELWRSRDIRAAKAAAVNDYLDALFQREHAMWLKARCVNEDLVRSAQLKLVRGTWWHQFMQQKTAHERSARVAATKIQRLVRKHQANAALAQTRQDRIDRRRTVARIEEIWVAVTNLQKTARMMFARRRCAAIRRYGKKRIESVLVLQRMCRVFLAKRRVRESNRQRAEEVRLYVASATRDYALRRMQAFFRMVLAKSEVQLYKQYLDVDRHRHATRIQGLVRGRAVRRRLRGLLATKATARHELAKEDMKNVAAVRIQKTVRMFLVRKALQECPSPSYQARKRLTVRKSKAAVRIQTVIRRALARMKVVTMLQRAKVHLRQALDKEHLHAYAIVIQCAVRRFLARNRVSSGLRRSPSDAAMTVQKQIRRFLCQRQIAARRQEMHESMVEDYEAEGVWFAVLQVQKMVRGFLARRRVRRFEAEVSVERERGVAAESE